MPKRTWSYSALGKFEKCPQSWSYQKINRLPDPSSPAMKRGNKIHARLEHAVRTGEVPDIQTFKLARYIKDLRKRAPHVEEMWVFDKNWRFLGVGGNNKWYDDAWLYAKLDVYLPPTQKMPPRVIDWKTGRIYPEHESQAHLYALAALSREQRDFPVVEVDMVYADQKEVHHMEIKTKDAVDQREEWTARANVLMTATEFPRKPGKHCDWCSFSQRKGGPCNELP